MPTRRQVERSRERNRKRGIDRSYIEAACAPLTDADRLRLQRESATGPRFPSAPLATAKGPVVSSDPNGGPEAA